MNPRNWFQSYLACQNITRSRRHAPNPRSHCYLVLEALEERAVPTASISIGYASAIEGNAALTFLDRFIPAGSGGLSRPRSLVFGPDGNHDGAQDLYVTDLNLNAILRYDGATGAFIDTFVASSSGGLNSPGDLAFGPDGSLYVTSNLGNQLLRYDGASGAFLGVVVSGLATPLGITFGQDGSLYIANQGTNEVLRYDNFGLNPFVTAGSGGLSQPRQGVFGPDGDFYVASQGTAQVLRYNGLTGAFVGVFASTNIGQGQTQGPIWLEFGTDGYLYTTARTDVVGLNTSIFRFNATTGAFADTLPIERDSWSFIVGPGGIVYYSGNGGANFIDRFGPSSLEAFTVSLDSASPTPVTVNYSTAAGTALAGSDYIGASGTLTFAPGVMAQTILIQTVDDTISETTETFTMNLSNAVGGSISGAQGIGTILDNDSTKFYVVNDGSTDQTYRYGATGNSFGNSALGAGDTAPRGAVSTAAGTTVWVVDANKKVYVYNSNGTLLGSWTAGSVASNAQLEGIATNGTDIWLVDNKQDKVFKYTGAASRLSGSQNAANSFNLNSGNSNPKDIVTDGASLWVVNDSLFTDKVFKYSVAGALLGNWTIAAANASPTGITLDPSNVGHLWIVDNGTDKVYQYDNAATRTSGSQSASATFTLAAGNTNPQGIADPPPPHASQQPSTSTTALDRVFAKDLDSWAELTSILETMQNGPLGRKRGVFTRSRR